MEIAGQKLQKVDPGGQGWNPSPAVGRTGELLELRGPEAQGGSSARWVLGSWAQKSSSISTHKTKIWTVTQGLSHISVAGGTRVPEDDKALL